MSEEVRAENCSDFSPVVKVAVELFTSFMGYNLNTKIEHQTGIYGVIKMKEYQYLIGKIIVAMAIIVAAIISAGYWWSWRKYP